MAAATFPPNGTTDPVQNVIRRLDKVRKSGSGWEARCPSHEGRDPSLSINYGNDGCALVKCFVGCKTEDIVAVLGLTMADLFVADERRNGTPVARFSRPLYMAKREKRKNERAKEPPTREISRRRYEIRDADGTLVAIHVRIDFDNGTKKMFWEGPNGEVGLGGRKVETLPLYGSERLAALGDGATVVVAEGEKATEALWNAGLNAVGTVTGASSAPSVDVLHCLDRFKVVLWPDNDKPGREHMATVAERLIGLEVSLRQVVWNEAPPKGDAADAPGGEEEIRNIVFLASPYRVGEKSDQSEQRSERAATGGFNLITLGALRCQPQENQEWVVDGLLVRGGTSVWGSKPKVGKTTLIRVLARSVASGEPFLGRRTTGGEVVILALEERAAKVRQHFEAMGAGSEVEDRILIHTGAAPQDAVGALRAVIDQYQPGLVVVDTLGRLCRARDWNDYSEVVRLLEPITEAARQTGTHICLLHHLGKSERVDEGDSILGSTAILGAVDAAILLKKRSDGSRTIRTIQRDGDNLDETILAHNKETGVVSLGADVAEERREAARDEVLEALGAEWLTEPDIRERVGGNNAQVSAALRSLFSDGKVRREGAGKRGDPYVYQRVDAPADPKPEPDSASAPADERTGTPSGDDWGEV